MIKEIKGDLFFSPAQVRCHQVNCKGVMGKGIAVQAKKYYPSMFEEYKNRCELFGKRNLGDVQFNTSSNGTILASMFAQNDYGANQRQTDYDSFENCLLTVGDFCRRFNLSVGFPYKIGCDLAGGDWNVIRKLLEDYFGGEDAPLCYIVKYDGENGVEPIMEQTEVPVAPTLTEQPETPPAEQAETSVVEQVETPVVPTPVEQVETPVAPTLKKGNFMPEVEIYTDGSCSGNPGPGGWAAILLQDDYVRELMGSEPHTTNNRMELLGVISALKALEGPHRVTIYTDSKYVSDAFNCKWLNSWQKNGWKTSKREPVKNKELWEELLNLINEHLVTWNWVKGHSVNPYNNRCDELAVKACREQIR